MNTPWSDLVRVIFAGIAASALSNVVDAAAPIVNTISPNPFIEHSVPQPTITITGTNFVSGFPIVRPTVMLRLQSNPAVQYSMVATTANFSGTTLTCAAGTNTFNLLNAPQGVYDVTVTRPDGQAGTLAGGFTVAAEQISGIHLTRAATWGGPVTDIEVQGNLAYLANGRALRILNIANPSQPIDVGMIDLVSVSSIEVRNGFVFAAATQPYRFCVVDVSNPAEPRLIWSSYGTSLLTYPAEVILHDNLAYVHERNDGPIYVYNISDLPNPTFVGQMPIGDIEKFAVADNKMYGIRPSYPDANDPHAVNGIVPASMRIYDLIANPLNPPPLGTFYANGVTEDSVGSAGLSVANGRACWAFHQDGSEAHTSSLRVIDVSVPASPTFVADRAFHWINGVDVSGDLALVADGAGGADPVDWGPSLGVAIVNLAGNPSSPPLIGNFKSHGNIRGVKVIGNRAFAFDEGEGLIILDIGAPTNPSRIGGYHSPWKMRNMAKAGDLLYISDAWNGFTILNVADPAHPQVAGVYSAQHFQGLGLDSWGIVVRDNRVYLAAGHLGLEVVDVSNSASPTLLGAHRLPLDQIPFSKYTALALKGNIAYVGKHISCCGYTWEGMLALNVQAPSNIMSVAVTTHFVGGDPLQTIALDLERNLAFLGLDSLFKTVDIASVQSLPVIHVGNVSSSPDLALVQDTLYVVDNENFNTAPGLYIEDVSNLANPVTLSVIDGIFPTGLTYPNGTPMTVSIPQAIALENNRLYMAGSANPLGSIGVYAIDVSSPESPVFLDVILNVGGGNSGVGSIGGAPDDSVRLLAAEPQVFIANAVSSMTTHSGGLVILTVEGIPIPLIGDINGDGVVNIDDLVIVITNWGPCLGPPPAPLALGGPGSGPGSGDMNCDFSTNTFDINPFMLALNDWEQYVKDYQDCDLFNGDMNNSGFPIDQADLAIFCPLAGGVVSGGQCLVPVPCPADVNGDGVVNIDDLVLVITHWG